MPENRPFDALCPPTDDGWWVAANEGRLQFRKDASAIEVAVDAPLRWTRDGRDISFEDALDTVPRALHGWMALAAVIGLRHTLGGLATGIALPAGRQEWPWMARRAEPVAAWIECLARLDGVDIPPVPDGIDDGLDLDGGD
jgi:hypothetical protein